jgi:hypothetical protein
MIETLRFGGWILISAGACRLSAGYLDVRCWTRKPGSGRGPGRLVAQWTDRSQAPPPKRAQDQALPGHGNDPG